MTKATRRSVRDMITNISIVSVFVKDVDESKQFYTDVLGFEAKDDITLAGGYRWCTVVHPNQPELLVNLTIPGAAPSAGTRRGDEAGPRRGRDARPRTERRRLPRRPSRS